MDTRPPTLGSVSLGPQDFPRVAFKDHYGVDAYLQCSSAIGPYATSLSHPGSSYLWLGVEDAAPMIMAKDAAAHGVSTDKTVGWVPFPIPPGVSLTTSMHLSREGVSGLIQRLQQWLDTGTFEDAR